MNLALKFASGPLTFLLLSVLPYGGVPAEGRLALSVFGWMVMWWMTQPVPWAISSLLPLVLFPALNVKSLDNTAAMYGQTIFFFIWGTTLVGHAMDRHGLAKRFALWFMSLRVIAGSSQRTVFGLMLATALVSTHISDAAAIAMMMPVAASLIAFVRSVDRDAQGRTNFGSFCSLGVLYGAIAGGTATIAGIPHNALSVSLLAKTTGRDFGFFEWMLAGVPIATCSLLLLYFVLKYFLPLEFKTIPGGADYLIRERQAIGRVTRGERATLFIFAVMVILFLLPSIVGLVLEPQHPVAAWSRRAISLNVVPTIALILMLITPVDWRKSEFVLGWKDALANTPWDIMLLVASATGVVGVLVEYKFVELASGMIANLGLGPYSLPFVAAVLVGFGTNFMSGLAATALFGGILIPTAQQIGFNPASMAMLVPNLAVGFALPWAGTSTGLAFAIGKLEIRQMAKVGIVATLAYAVLVATMHILLSPFV